MADPLFGGSTVAATKTLLSGFMTSLCNAASWISLIAVNQVSPVLVSSLFNISGTLLFFATVSFAQFVFILLAVPETKVSYYYYGRTEF